MKVKISKKILALFIAISMVTPDVGVCSNSLDILDFIPALIRPKFCILSLNKTTAAPFDIIKINGRKFSQVSDMLVIFSKGPYVVKVPPISVTANNLEVPVPVFFNTSNGAVGPGIVSIKVILKSQNIISNSISGLNITGLPSSTYAAGTVTLTFLKDMKTLLGYAQSQLNLLQQWSQGKVNTALQADSLTTLLSTLGGLETAITAIMNDQPLTGSSQVKVTKQSLAIADRLILGYLTQLNNAAGTLLNPAANAISEEASVPWSPPVPETGKRKSGKFRKNKTTVGTATLAEPGETSVPMDMAAMPTLKEAYEKLVSYVSNINFDEQKLLEFMKKNEAVVGTAGAVVGALVLLGVVAETSPIVVAIGGFALVYSMAMAFETITDYMCCYLGLPSGVTKAQGFLPLAKKLFETGLEMKTFHIPDTSLPKQLVEIYLQSSTNIELAKTLVEPVSNNTQTIYNQLISIKITLSPQIIDAVVDCIYNPPPSSGGQFTLWSGTISVSAPDYVSWSVKIPILPEQGSTVTVTPSSGTGSKIVNVVIKYPDKVCTCPCSLSWASGQIAEFQAITTGIATGAAILSVSVDYSSCYCY